MAKKTAKSFFISALNWKFNIGNYLQ